MIFDDTRWWDLRPETITTHTALLTAATKETP